jgi:hypothetical protein
MPVDVEWDGVSLAKAAAVREQDGGWFVELEQPMPVGTSVVLSGDVQATVTVTRVHEGIGAGMLVKKGDVRAASGGDGEPESSAGGGDKKEKRKKKR